MKDAAIDDGPDPDLDRAVQHAGPRSRSFKDAEWIRCRDNPQCDLQRKGIENCYVKNTDY